MSVTPEQERASDCWHVISGEGLREMLRRVESGEPANWVYLEEYVNADRDESDEAA